MSSVLELFICLMVRLIDLNGDEFEAITGKKFENLKPVGKKEK